MKTEQTQVLTYLESLVIPKPHGGGLLLFFPAGCYAVRLHGIQDLFSRSNFMLKRKWIL